MPRVSTHAHTDTQTVPSRKSLRTSLREKTKARVRFATGVLFGSVRGSPTRIPMLWEVSSAHPQARDARQPVSVLAVSGNLLWYNGDSVV